jgi:hypothetical protein
MEDRINLNIDEENINIHIDETPSFTVEINPIEDVIIELNEQGPAGPRGLRGETGRGISNIELTNTVGLVDTYTIAYDDNTTSTFNITNGRDAIITSANATVNDTVGTPSVNIITNGTPYDRSFTFEFENLKGEQGIQGPQGERGPVGPQGPEGGTRAGAKGDYCTTYGIEYCQYGLITNPVGTKNITVKGGMMLCVPGAETKITIGSDINYAIESSNDVTIFYVDGNLLEVDKISYSIAEPVVTSDGYIAWWNPEHGKWQFKSNDTGNVWRDGNATPLADIRIDNGVVTRIDYIGYRVLNDDIYALKSDLEDNIQDLNSEINNTNNTISNLGSTYANISLSNLSNTGEKHFLNKSQITNCLLEVPQRIKYTLEDGTLTVKAGSVVIVPYGVEDLTSQYPKGTTFLNENFKVYDTQFANGKFFVWAEVQNDKSSKPAETAINDRFVGLCISLNDYTRNNNVSSGPGDATGNWFVHYSTDKNIVMTTNGSGEINQAQYGTTSLPFLIATGDGVNSYGSIKQVFNGFGYIGSTAWLDKGVKCLIPNGRNEDGTLRNIEYTTSNMGIVSSQVGNFNDNIWLRIHSNPIAIGVINSNRYYDSDNNYYVKDGENVQYCVVGKMVVDKTLGITEFNVKQPFRAVDYSDIQSLLNNIGDIGKPQISLDNNLPANCIWLEGATVSRTTYAKLFELYGTTYGAGDGSTTFVLPDFRNRAIWGSNSFGYIEAGLPNITGQLGAIGGGPSTATGAFYDAGSSSPLANTGKGDGLAGFDASRSNAIYGKSNTVQPPAIKVRVYTKYQ